MDLAFFRINGIKDEWIPITKGMGAKQYSTNRYGRIGIKIC